MRVAALEDNVSFLERWCEEQQDLLDRTAGPIAYEYEREPEPRQVLRIVDLRDAAEDDEDEGAPDGGDVDTIVAIVATDHDRPIHQLQDRLNRLRRRLALTVAPPADAPRAPAATPARPGARRLSVKPASRTAP